MKNIFGSEHRFLLELFIFWGNSKWYSTKFYFLLFLLTKFFYSGVYISLDFFSKKKRKISLASYIKFVFEKWIRFNIRCIGPILVIYLLSASGDGPVWHLGDQHFVNSCKNNYWQNLLFINNYVKGIENIVSKKKFY